MALRALLFTSDGTSSAVLCQVLTSLGIDAEICSELLVARERIAKGGYDTVLVDWENENEATALLKGAREQKGASQSLNLALVESDKDIARALQQGANSAIRKPIDPQQAHDTLSTARSLILSRQAEQKEKDARVAAVRAAVAAAADEYSEEEKPAPKTGYVSQTAPRSALEAVQKVENSARPIESSWQAGPGPASPGGDPAEARNALRVEKRPRWDAPQPAPPQPITHRSAEADYHPGSAGILWPPVEEEETRDESGSRPQPKYLLFSVAACLLVAGILYVWAPGGSYPDRLRSWFHSVSDATHPQSAATVAPEMNAGAVAAEKPTPALPAKSDDLTPGPDPVDSTEVDPSKIQVIETKAIPKPGAQQPPTGEADAAPAVPPPPKSDTNVPADQWTETAQAPSTEQPQVRLETAPAVPRQAPTPLAAAPVPNHLPAAEGRGGVVIPDSLRTAPWPAPTSSLEPSIVSEEAARALIIHRVDPDYPAQALPQRLEGPVVLEVWVRKDGTIRDLKLVKGYFVLAKAASDAVKQWRFKPYTPNGPAVDFQTLITISFRYPG
jgi:protein TonB